MAKNFRTFTVDQEQTLSSLIKGPRTIASIKAGGVGDGFVLGSIEWSKDLGRPDGPKLADKFDIILNFPTTKLDRQTGRRITIDTPIPIHGKWDGMADQTSFRVNFVHSGLKSDADMLEQQNRRVYTIEVTHAHGAHWSGGTLPGNWIRTFVHGTPSFKKDPGPVWLKPIEIIAKPFIFINP